MVTPQELCEIEEIKEVRYLYTHYYDGQRVEELANLFTEDAVCEFGEEYGGNWVGREQIYNNYKNFIDGEGDDPHGVMHAVTNPWIRLADETTAHGRWYLLDLRTTPGVENPLILFGIYDETYEKTDDGWKIARTRIDFLWPRREYQPSTNL